MVLIVPPNGDIFTLDVDPNTTTLHLLKVAIEQFHGIHVSNQRLYLSESLCENDSDLISNLGIVPSSTLTLGTPPDQSADTYGKGVEKEEVKEEDKKAAPDRSTDTIGATSKGKESRIRRRKERRQRAKKDKQKAAPDRFTDTIGAASKGKGNGAEEANEEAKEVNEEAVLKGIGNGAEEAKEEAKEVNEEAVSKGIGNGAEEAKEEAKEVNEEAAPDQSMVTINAAALKVLAWIFDRLKFDDRND